MKSFKPGRGPSMMGAIMGVGVSLFGVFWCVLAAAMGAWFMIPFGLIFIGMAVASTVMNYRNATGKNRYSTFDITEDGEEPDPLEQRFGSRRERDEWDETAQPRRAAGRFCPYCGAKQRQDFRYCSSCGRELPEKYE